MDSEEFREIEEHIMKQALNNSKVEFNEFNLKLTGRYTNKKKKS